jgi:hypothetical protein
MMWIRKNFLTFALFLNCAYFIGVSAIVVRHFSREPHQDALGSWVNEGAELITQQLILDTAARAAMMAEVGDPDSELKIKTWAHPHNIVNFIERKQENSQVWIGARKDVPFTYADLKEPGSVGFSRKDERLFFSYLLENSAFSFYITQEKAADALKMQLSAFGMGMTVIESENTGDTRVLYTNLPSPIADDLLAQTDFEAMPSSKQFTLSQERYFVKTINLVHSPQLKQKMLFTKKITHYQIVSLVDILIFVWTFFIISVVLNLVLFKYSKNEAG